MCALVEIAPLSARFEVTDPLTGATCEVDIRKEVSHRPITHSADGPVLSEENVIDTRPGPWHVRGRLPNTFTQAGRRRLDR